MKRLFGFLMFIFYVSFSHLANAQGEGDDLALEPEPAKLVKITGVLADIEDLQPLTYANVIIKNSNTGTITNDAGFFVILAKAGDTLQFSEVGYKTAEYTLPDKLTGENYSLIELMYKDTILLDEVIIRPWPTEEELKREFLQYTLEDTRNQSSQEKLRGNSEMVRQSEWFLHDSQREGRLYEITGQAQPMMNSFFNPNSWSRFLNDWRSGKFKGIDKPDYNLRDN
ncbi:MAG: carboxypeptidase-like regulatory domain-containing protein [Cyclobacteriaceae bacterium]|nr:carboxypeptidase-like regulatory domain-containing protein [Cyclobacteriaceae bacterium]MCH8517407.1 carboxypeptidase-like regulatory domain-containing protein [Cyclobacteriaceae bacterium]